MAETHPLFVRLPAAAAERLERTAAETGASKREIVTRLITGDDVVVGRHTFRPAEPPEVLTVAQAAELLQVEPAAVDELAAAGELPGRRVGGEWRFARAAVLAWLGAAA
jgi:excisionase family DNA binding protein